MQVVSGVASTGPGRRQKRRSGRVKLSFGEVQTHRVGDRGGGHAFLVDISDSRNPLLQFLRKRSDCDLRRSGRPRRRRIDERRHRGKRAQDGCKSCGEITKRRATLSAALPQINAKTRCPQHASASDVEVTFLQIQLSSSSFFSPSSGLEVTGDVSSKYCALGISLGRARFSLPLSVALSTQGSRLPKVVISAGQLDLEPYNDFGPLRLAFTTPQGKQFVEKKINETVSKKVSDLNKQVQHFVVDLANQQIFQAFDPTIDLNRMELQGEDLAIEFSLTGQLNGSAVAAWIENRQPKISVLKSRARTHKMAGSRAGV